MGGAKLVKAFSVKGVVDMFHISVGFFVALVAGALVETMFPDRFSIGPFVVIVTCQIVSGGIVVVLRTSDGRDGVVRGNLSFSFLFFSCSLFSFWRFLFEGSGCVQSLA